MKLRTRISRLLRDQSGMTLLETLASLFIFLIILIPLTSVYVSGVQVFNQTREQTDLRNVADFAIGEVMRTVQGATYFELEKDGGSLDSENEEMDTLRQIMQSKKAGELLLAEQGGAGAGSNGAIDAEEGTREIGVSPQFSTGLVVFTSSTVYVPSDQDSSDAESGSTQSFVKRNVYRFTPSDPSDGLVKSFRFEPGYLVRGLFSTSADNKTLSLYLVVAPYGERVVDRDGQQMRFQNLEEVRAELERTEASGKVNSYIRLVKTEFAVSNLQRSE